MAVTSGFVGSSAKLETGKEWMSEARKELRLSPNGWMSEMVGKSTEVRFVNTVNRTQASIHELMGSPTAATVYIFENTATISAATQGGWALQTGTFPAGSTLKIINRGRIQGGGGNGGSTGAGDAGGTALVLNFPSTIDNAGGTLWGGGGGGGGTAGKGGGGGGSGLPAGKGGAKTGAGEAGSSGSQVTGGAGGGNFGGRGGGRGAPGGAGREGGAGGRGGYSVDSNSNAVTWIDVGSRSGAVV